MEPPLHPFEVSSQLTSSCSEREVRVPVAMATRDSIHPVVENAQHDPHEPWFFTPVTLPLVTQLTLSATSTTARRRPCRSLALADFKAPLLWNVSSQTLVTTLSLNSCGVMSVK